MKKREKIELGVSEFHQEVEFKFANEKCKKSFENVLTRLFIYDIILLVADEVATTK